MDLKVRKRLLALLLTSTLFLNHRGVKANNLEEVNQGDYLRSTVDLNIRVDNNVDSMKIGLINENAIVERILMYDNEWSVIRYKDLIGFAKNEYLEVLPDYHSNINHTKINDIVEFDSKVNFRIEPNLEGKRITSISKGELADVLAKTDNGWYLISYNGTIGYVCGEYVTSILDKIRSLYPEININELDLSKVAYATSGLNVRCGIGTDNDKIGFLNKYESIRVLGEYNGWYLILTTDNLLGFVDKSYTKKLDDTFVVIDLSEQQLWLYDEDTLLLTTDVVTGKNSTPTNTGLFKIYKKERNRYLIGEDYKSYVNYWMPFDGGIGLHDASWRKSFGGNIYQKNGSHGCVNMPPSITDEIYDAVSVGTKVLVHK